MRFLLGIFITCLFIALSVVIFFYVSVTATKSVLTEYEQHYSGIYQTPELQAQTFRQWLKASRSELTRASIAFEQQGIETTLIFPRYRADLRQLDGQLSSMNHHYDKLLDRLEKNLGDNAILRGLWERNTLKNRADTGTIGMGQAFDNVIDFVSSPSEKSQLLLDFDKFQYRHQQWKGKLEGVQSRYDQEIGDVQLSLGAQVDLILGWLREILGFEQLQQTPVKIGA